MKKLVRILSVGVVACFLGSCTIYRSTVITDNPVGSKKHVVKATSLSKDIDMGVGNAAKAGGIKKIATVDRTTKHFIILFEKLVITGE